MKYLHSGYILFCQNAEHGDDGRLDLNGLIDVFALEELPVEMKCACVIGFGTPFERRQYKGFVNIVDPTGREVLSREFSANNPDDVYKGHYVFSPEMKLDKEGAWTVKVLLKNWKNENMWDFERKFWCMKHSNLDGPPDP